MGKIFVNKIKYSISIKGVKTKRQSTYLLNELNVLKVDQLKQRTVCRIKTTPTEWKLNLHASSFFSWLLLQMRTLTCLMEAGTFVTFCLFCFSPVLFRSRPRRSVCHRGGAGDTHSGVGSLSPDLRASSFPGETFCVKVWRASRSGWDTSGV